MFHIGQLVVCVDDSNMALRKYEIGPCRGYVYTVRGICVQTQGLLLEEIVNPPDWHNEGWCECVFFARRFRPVAKRNEEIIASLLQPVLEREIA